MGAVRKRTATPVDDRIISSKELTQRIPLNRTSIYRMVRQGRFPPPIQITASRIGWRLSTVLAWMADRETDPLTPRTYFGKTPKA